jgi:CRP/FNR family transcriptional regulator, cyclic AMP receptor protein
VKAITTPSQQFDVEAFLTSAGTSGHVVHYRPAQRIFSQGDPCESVMYVREGTVRLSVFSASGKEAVVAMIGPGDFLGEGALADRPLRLGTARAVEPTTLLVIPKEEMTRLLREEHTMSNRFIEYLLNRNIRVEADLVDQLFNSSEKRLARALLLLARYGKPEEPHRLVPKISQEVLAEMIGTTRSRVNFFMNKFRKLGFIEYDGAGLKIHGSLLSVVLHE